MSICREARHSCGCCPDTIQNSLKQGFVHVLPGAADLPFPLMELCCSERRPMMCANGMGEIRGLSKRDSRGLQKGPQDEYRADVMSLRLIWLQWKLSDGLSPQPALEPWARLP
jgi:hypothetical protein